MPVLPVCITGVCALQVDYNVFIAVYEGLLVNKMKGAGVSNQVQGAGLQLIQAKPPCTTPRRAPPHRRPR